MLKKDGIKYVGLTVIKDVYGGYNKLKALVIGGGMAGCCAAHFLTDQGWYVDLIEKEAFLGGGCKTFTYGGHPYTYGPRHFLTKDEKLFDFLNKYVPMRRIQEHEFLTFVESDPGFYNFPIHKADIDLMPDRDKINSELASRKELDSPQNLEEYWINSVGPTLYKKFVDNYSKKMWAIGSNAEIDTFSWSPKGVALKSGAKAAWTEAISSFPIKLNGYDDYFEIATCNTSIHLNTEIESYDVENMRVKIDNEWKVYDIIVNSISPEIILNNAFGPLRWIGRDFFKIVLPVKEVFPENIYFIYYANDEPFTRMVEYKKLYKYDSPTTLLGMEIPSFNNNLYPYPLKKDQEQAQKYFDALPEKVFSIGRAGTYRYIDIDDIILECMELVEKLK